MTREQATAFHKYALRGEVHAATVGIGSDGYKPSLDMWVVLATGRAFFIAPDGSERDAA